MPTLKAIHICNSHKPTLQPKIAKEYVFANAENQADWKKSQRTTYSLWRVSGYQQGFRFVASFGFGGQESALKPPQSHMQTVSYKANEKL
tara:strand:+ start:263706 stop:263975 length:270 start_codon:yes stop_codon:yes gene_type:complete